MRDIVATLVNGALGRRDQIPSEFWLVVFGLRLPRIALGILVGAALSTSRGRLSGAAAQSAGRSVRAGRFERRGAGRDPQFDRGSAHAGLDSGGGVCGRGGDDHGGVFPGAARRDIWTARTLLLAGIISASFLSAVIMFLMTTLSGRDLRGMAFWLMGDLSSAPAVDLRWLYLLLLIGAGSIYTTRPT